MHLILVFGSLRKTSSKGYNHGRCGDQHYRRTLKLEGYDLFSLGAYPAICEGTGALTCELHEVDDETFRRIDRMEKGAGYGSKTISLPEGDATIYMQTPDQLAGCPKVPSGDWA